MEKYYTPDIEEFHIGFEFDIMEYAGKLLPGSIVNKHWNSVTIDDSYDFNTIWDIFNEKKNNQDLRVKYLDSEDIESLGFRKSPSRDFYGTEILVYTFDFIGTDDSFGNMKTCELNIDTYTNIIRVEDYDWPLFMGKIKNKSELKKLLKQLCITK
jgi:hypothetical protein